MIDLNIIKSIFTSHHINKIILIDETSSYTFVICSMHESISSNKWDNLENILKYHVKKDVTILSHPQALKYLGNDFLNKGVIIDA